MEFHENDTMAGMRRDVDGLGRNIPVDEVHK